MKITKMPDLCKFCTGFVQKAGLENTFVSPIYPILTYSLIGTETFLFSFYRPKSNLELNHSQPDGLCTLPHVCARLNLEVIDKLRKFVNKLDKFIVTPVFSKARNRRGLFDAARL